MPMTLAPSTLPLRIDEFGTIRIGGTRVTLDTVVESYNVGNTPEQIADGFPSVELADIYSAIAYYLSHREQIDSYLHAREQSAEEVRRQSPDLFPVDVRQRLESRKSLKQGD